MSDEQAVKVGDRFLWIDGDGELGEVTDVQPEGSGWRASLVTCDEHQWYSTRILCDAWYFRRVPPGYTVPTVPECLAGIERLCAARDAMAADPETGTKGVMRCIDEMAKMAGIEVRT